MKSSTKVIAGVVIVLVIAMFVYWTQRDQAPMEQTNNTNTTENTDTNTATPTETASSTPVSSSYKDGNYNVVTDYMSPGGPDQLGIDLTLKGNVITSVKVTNMAGDSTSKMYQNKFISGINSAVVGKNISDLKIGVVSGASLASNAFNKALVEVRTKAQM